MREKRSLASSFRAASSATLPATLPAAPSRATRSVSSILFRSVRAAACSEVTGTRPSPGRPASALAAATCPSSALPRRASDADRRSCVRGSAGSKACMSTSRIWRVSASGGSRPPDGRSVALASAMAPFAAARPWASSFSRSPESSSCALKGTPARVPARLKRPLTANGLRAASPTRPSSVVPSISRCRRSTRWRPLAKRYASRRSRST